MWTENSIPASSNAGTIHNLTNGQPLIMGTRTSANGADGTVPYSGAVDELDLWNRALTDVEIAAIYQAGTNHIGKATPASILPQLPKSWSTA